MSFSVLNFFYFLFWKVARKYGRIEDNRRKYYDRRRMRKYPESISLEDIGLQFCTFRLCYFVCPPIVRSICCYMLQLY